MIDRKNNGSKDLKFELLIMTVIVIFVKLLGFCREVVLAYCYGTSNISDAYLIAYSIPTILFTLIAKAISTAYTPIFLKIEKENGIKESNIYTSKICNIFLAICIILIILVEIFPNQVVLVFASGFDYETTVICVDILRIGIFSIIFMLLTSLFSAYLQTKQKYIICAIVSLPLNIILIILFFISKKMSYHVLGYGLIMAFLSEFVLLLPFICKTKFRYTLSFKYDLYIKDTIVKVLPVMVGSCASQVNKLIDRTMASTISGGVSALSYASLINISIQELIVTSLLSMITVEFSRLVLNLNYKLVTSKLQQILIIVSILLVPITIILMLFDSEVVKILFMRGAFDENSTKKTSVALFYYSIGLLFVAVRDIYVRVYNSHQNTLIPAISSVIMVISNIVLNLILSRYLGVGGLALASSVSAIVGCFILTITFEKKYYAIFDKKFWINLFKVILLSLLCCGVAYVIYYFLTLCDLWYFIAMILSLLVGMVLYFALLWLFKVNEFIKIVKYVFKKIRREKNV